MVVQKLHWDSDRIIFNYSSISPLLTTLLNSLKTYINDEYISEICRACRYNLKFINARRAAGGDRYLIFIKSRLRTPRSRLLYKSIRSKEHRRFFTIRFSSFITGRDERFSSEFYVSDHRFCGTWTYPRGRKLIRIVPYQSL